MGTIHQQDRMQIISYNCDVARVEEGEQFIAQHSISLVLSGTMELGFGKSRQQFTAGEIFICRKNQLLKFTKFNGSEKNFKSLSIFFDESMLLDFGRVHGYKPTDKAPLETVFAIRHCELLNSFMQSLALYENLLSPGNDDLLARLKQQEALLLLLHYDPVFKNILFDFSLPVKTDLETYMEENFHFNVPLEKFAFLTGRSLSSFKRDFHQIFGETPSRWLLKRRLDAAYQLISRQGRSASEIYLDLGFQDLSHFSFSFKKRFGTAPSQLIA